MTNIQNTETNTPVKAKAPKAPKAKVLDAIYGPYGNKLKFWPKAAGPVPTRDQLITARALLAGGRPASKRELAVAAYLRPQAGNYTTHQIGVALSTVFNNAFNEILNVVNIELVDTHRLCTATKVKITPKGDRTGTSYSLALTPKGEKAVKQWRADHGMVIPVEPVANTVEAGPMPVAAALVRHGRLPDGSVQPVGAKAETPTSDAPVAELVTA
jgi:hypothetical protein